MRIPLMLEMTYSYNRHIVNPTSKASDPNFRFQALFQLANFNPCLWLPLRGESQHLTGVRQHSASTMASFGGIHESNRMLYGRIYSLTAGIDCSYSPSFHGGPTLVCALWLLSPSPLRANYSVNPRSREASAQACTSITWSASSMYEHSTCTTTATEDAITGPSTYRPGPVPVRMMKVA
ncbi:hypothetical protein TsFJ059_002844 [Trichoderma semiorbis]|uniref:Uncharacterized protein n=1 Tax=Trichoderma semiorbis TaxID=1491008 RepID=A0A9P8HHE3_9HYPO|nr:hypothetical protein TsFJ059_002844 [Trichoderma semiorbis]